MMFSNTLAGVMMMAVHLLAPTMLQQAGEYGLFIALLGILNLLMVMTPGIQTVFTYEAAAVSTQRENQLMSGYAIGVIKYSFIFWCCLLLLALVFYREIFRFYKMDNPWPFVVTLMVGLLQLWLPVFLGILQGMQRFYWFGLCLLANGGGRVVAALVLVYILGSTAQAVMLGVLTGVLVSLATAFFCVRIYLKKSDHIPCDWPFWLRRALPLALAPIAFQMMMTADMIFFRSLMSLEDSDYYGIAGMLGRGMVMLLGPLAGVMFPKLIKSHREGQANMLLIRTLMGTFIIGGATLLLMLGMAWGWQSFAENLRGFSGDGLLAKVAERILAKEDGLTFSMGLLPWFAAGMMFLSLSQVLITNLLAYRKYRALTAPFLIVLAYVVSLAYLPQNGQDLVQLILLFNLLLLLVLILLVWGTGTWRRPDINSPNHIQANE
ncbi:MAG: hypothetical protein P8L18_11640 [Verrucomicrobiota bacterium]|nr:hypothetical protein [Verrucomicrobiota bacterium]